MGTHAVNGAARVLVVDDHDGFRATARRMLEADGWLVVGEAVDGASAIDAAARVRPDVILLDIGLPDMDGFMVADRLATAEGPLVILVSSRDSSAYRDRLLTSPAAAFIGKGDLDGACLRRILAARTERA